MIVRETRIKAAGIKQEEDQRCPKTNGLLELNSFFFGARLSFTRRIRTSSRNMEKKKKRKMRAEEKALLTWPSHASPSHLHYSIQHPCLFFESPFSYRRPRFPFHCLFAGTLFSSRSWRWYIKNLRSHFGQKYRYFFVKGLLCLPLILRNTDII